MKQRIISSFVGFTCAVCTAAAFGQAYPTKPIRIVAPFAPGGGTDLIARFAAQKMTESLGQQTVVDNRPGAGGTLGAGSYAVNPSRFKLKFDSINDITPIIQLSQAPFLVVVHPSLPVKNVK